jgi:hypothetical protein
MKRLALLITLAAAPTLADDDLRLDIEAAGRDIGRAQAYCPPGDELRQLRTDLSHKYGHTFDVAESLGEGDSHGKRVWGKGNDHQCRIAHARFLRCSHVPEGRPRCEPDYDPLWADDAPGNFSCGREKFNEGQRRFAQLRALHAPADVIGTFEAASALGQECLDLHVSACANFLGAHMKVEAAYDDFIFNNPPPWRTRAEECAAIGARER